MDSNKILVLVYVPMIEKEYDIMVPINKKIKNVTRLINEAVSELSNGCFPIKNDLLLYERRTGNLLDVMKNVKDAGLVNGSQIILI